MKKILISLIKIYKRTFSVIFIPMLGFGCRYSPTCSDYSMQSIQKYGVRKGLLLSAKRVGSCHPLGRRPTVDPVP